MHAAPWGSSDRHSPPRVRRRPARTRRPNGRACPRCPDRRRARARARPRAKSTGKSPRAVDADHPRRVGERRDLARAAAGSTFSPATSSSTARSLRRARPRRDPRPRRRTARASPRQRRSSQLADELSFSLSRGGDQARDAGRPRALADFACSAIAPNALGSCTARSASTLRSSSISAAFSRR